jgi:hypothetical protein
MVERKQQDELANQAGRYPLHVFAFDQCAHEMLGREVKSRPEELAAECALDRY